MEIYLSLGVTQDVETQSVPRIDDGVSAPIFTEFPLGLLQETTIYVCDTHTHYRQYGYLLSIGGYIIRSLHMHEDISVACQAHSQYLIAYHMFLTGWNKRVLYL